MQKIAADGLEMTEAQLNDALDARSMTEPQA